MKRRDNTLGITVHHVGISEASARGTPEQIARACDCADRATARVVNQWHSKRWPGCLVRRSDYGDQVPTWPEWTASEEATIHIGYHLLIHPDGTYELGRPWDAIGAHCKAARHNYTHVSVCLAGSREHRPVPAAQRTTLVRILVEWCRRAHLVATAIEGHRESGAKTECPGRFVMTMLPEIRAEVAAQLA